MTYYDVQWHHRSSQKALFIFIQLFMLSTINIYIVIIMMIEQLPEVQTNKYYRRSYYRPPPKEDSSGNYKKLICVIALSMTFITAESIGGYLSHSISVISDAFHLVSDLAGFIISFLFLWYAKKLPTPKMSFGYHRIEVIGALANLFIIWILSIFLIYESTNRIIYKQFVQNPKIMLIVAVGGLPVNILMYCILHSGDSHSHGLMSENCGEQYPVEGLDTTKPLCEELICDDIKCLMSNQYEEHCHKKVGDSDEIHKHQVKVVVEGGEIKRKVTEPKKHQHNHKEGEKCSHSHDKANNNESQGRIHNDHLGHSHSDGHKHDHNHEGHNHDHNHEGHNHDGHNHAGHDHAGHDHGHGHGHGHSHQNLSMKAAVLHALSDIIQSIGLIISSLIIFFFGSHYGEPVTEWNNWHYFDPITTYVFCGLVFVSTYPITKNCYYLIMQATPENYQPEKLKQQFMRIKGMVDVHDLHIWDLRPGKTILIAHMFAEEGHERSVLKQLTDLCRKKRIYHSTFQVEEVLLRDDHSYILCDHDIH